MKAWKFALILLPAAGQAATRTIPLDRRPVRNSFVDRKVGSAADLLAHVRTDPVVMDRYVRHFQMNRSEVLHLLGGLHRGVLAQTGVYTIYSVPPDGHIKMHVGRILKGEPMFLNAQDQPVLVAKCGNPVVLGPRRATAHLTAPMSETPSAAREIEATPDLSEPMEDGALLTVTPSVPGAFAEIAPAPVFAAAQPTIVAPALPTVTGSGWIGATWLLSFAGAAAVLPPRPAIPREPVPEPAGYATLAVGAASLLRKRKKSL